MKLLHNKIFVLSVITYHLLTSFHPSEKNGQSWIILVQNAAGNKAYFPVANIVLWNEKLNKSRKSALGNDSL